MKVAGVLIMFLALVIAVVPMFTDCQSQGKALTTADGRTIPMKCHWTGQAELALAVPTFFLGGMFTFNRRRDSRLLLALLGSVVGVMAILLPTQLIGVCSNPDMICNSIMKPTLILSGAVLVGLSLVSMVALTSRQPQEQPA